MSRLFGPLAHSTFRTSLALGLRLAVQATTLVMLARLLEPATFGAFAAMAALAVIIGTLSGFGLNLVLMGALADHTCQRTKVLSYAIPMNLGLGAIGCGFFVVSCRWLVPQELGISVALAIGIAEIQLQPLVTLVATESHAAGRVARSQLLQALPLIARMALVIGIATLEPASPLDIYSRGYLLASLGALCFGLSTMAARWPGPREWRAPRHGELANAAGYAFANLGGTGTSELDKTLAARLLPLEQVGLYAAASRVLGALTLPVGAMILAAMPRLFQRHNPARSWKLGNAMLFVAIGYGVSTGGLLWMGAPYVAALFGPGYDGMTQPLRWLCLVAPATMMRLVATHTISARGRPWARTGLELSGLLILAMTSWPLATHFGTGGLVLAFACAEWIMALTAVAILMGGRPQLRSN